MAGFPTDKANVDGKVGHLALTIRDALDEAARVKAWLDSKTDADLIALGYVAGDVAVIKSAFTDLNNLRQVATGQQAQATANNFLFWSAKLTGLN